jgi:PAS domain S-box-containing protein
VRVQKAAAGEYPNPDPSETFYEETDLISPGMRAALLDQGAWSQPLENYARTVGMAVALTDCNGRQLGTCHNPQPVWMMARRMATGETAKGRDGAGGESPCPFCLDLVPPCGAVKKALSEGRVQTVRDVAGLVHVTVPLALGRRHVGALIAGQVFDRYPQPLRLQRVARTLGVSSQDLWCCARTQAPIRSTTIQVFGDLLFSLGTAFLRDRFAAVLDQDLKITNHRLRVLLDKVEGHSLFTVDGAGFVTSWNRGAERMFGYAESDVLGEDYSRFFTPDDIRDGAPAKLLSDAYRGESVADEGWRIRKDGERFYSEGSLTALGEADALEFARLTVDITARRNTEEALRHTQRLESIGVLASGIAHDFNNLLTSIMGGVSVAKAGLAPNDEAYPWLSIAEEAADKAADLANQLLAYGGKGKFLVTRFDLSATIRDMVNLLQTSIAKPVELQLELDGGLPEIEGDESQIQQIVMNLVINGAESIGPEGGRLRVSTGMAGRQVFMEVRDSGSGMTDATKAHIFEPFFTTKFTGRGLGLAAVAGIVHGHHGSLLVESALGEGSVFRISFPCVQIPTGRRGETRPVDKAATLPPPTPGEATGTVLVVDDESGLRKIARGILEHAGYKVLTAKDGREAVETFRENADVVTAVLLDMTMPVMGGEDAFRLIREIRPGVPIVISTGYSEAATRELFTGTSVGFVQKPYKAALLCEGIRAISEIGERASCKEQHSD